MQSVDNVIFDLGGVLMDISFEATAQAFEKITGSDFKVFFDQHRQDDLFDQFETGRISPEAFREGIRKLMGKPLTDEDIDWAWNAILVDIPTERFEMVKKLRTQKRVFLLSNTNAIHKKAFDAMFAERFPGEQIESLFEGAYFSHLLHDRKPNPSIYKKVVEIHTLDPSLTLFIDDLPQNVEGAKKAGLQALHLASPTSVLDLEWE